MNTREGRKKVILMGGIQGFNEDLAFKLGLTSIKTSERKRFFIFGECSDFGAGNRNDWEWKVCDLAARKGFTVRTDDGSGFVRACGEITLFKNKAHTRNSDETGPNGYESIYVETETMEEAERALNKLALLMGMSKEWEGVEVFDSLKSSLPKILAKVESEIISGESIDPPKNKSRKTL